MRVFFAAPFTGKLRKGANGSIVMDAAFRQLLELIETALLAAGHSVFLAHRREQFGAALMDSGQCTPLDMLELNCADCVVAVVGDSYGVHVELGWAAAIGKPIILLCDAEMRPTTPLLTGLDAVTRTITMVLPKGPAVSPEFLDRLLALIDQFVGHRRPRRRKRWAFLSTTSGFGPAAKAAAIAQVVVTRAPHVSPVFFGAGIDREFALKSGAFDAVFKIDVDDRGAISHLLPLLADYDAVIGVTARHVAELWPRDHPPLYYVDTLAWMRSDLLPGISNAATYFVQDFLVPEQRLLTWRDRAAVELVGPIIREFSTDAIGRESKRLLLVKLSCCHDSVGVPDRDRQYAHTLVEIILQEAAGHWDEIIVCCNERLADWLSDRFPDGKGLFRHLPPDEFGARMAQAQLLLTNPGMTTTLEAMGVQCEVRFLPPQNHCQALISEHYRAILGDSATMALSQFKGSFAVDQMLPQTQNTARVIEAIAAIVTDHRHCLREIIRQRLTLSERLPMKGLERLSSRRWCRPGQESIVEHILADVDNSRTVRWH